MKSVIPEAALDKHIAVLGKTGSGKTYGAKGLVEHLLDEGRQVCVLDPTAAWWGLRLGHDGKKAGYDVVLLGGKHGDIPLSDRSGEAVARLVTGEHANVVIDTSGMTVGEYTRWFIAFAGTLYTTVAAPLHLVIDEAHYFMPQGGGGRLEGDAGKMLHAGNRLMSGGRSLGIRGLMISQRPAKLHKDALTCADTLVAMRMIAPQDRKAVKDWIDGAGDPEKGKELLDSLAGLQRGEGWVWYPEGEHLKRTNFPAIKTYDSSSTPKHGARSAPKVSEIDLDKVRASMADAVKQAEANDPKLLRARLADLENKLRNQKPQTIVGEKIVEKRVEIPVLKNGQLDKANRLVDRMMGLMNEARELYGPLANAIARATSSPPPKPTLQTAPAVKPAPRLIERAPKPPSADAGDVKEGLTGPAQRILDALAELQAIGVCRPERVQVAFLAGYSNLNSKGFTNGLGTLRTAGLIDYPETGRVLLTDAGQTLAQSQPQILTTAELHDRIMRLLGGSHNRLLKPLIDAYPNDLSRQDLMAAAGYTNANSKGFTNALGRLRSLGLIDYPTQGRAVALPLLFPEALA